MSNIYGYVEGKEPLKSFIKRCTGKLFVYVLNPFTKEKEGLLLAGDHRKPDESCIYDVYSPEEELFFRRSNRRHFETGDLVDYRRVEKEPTEEEKLNRMSEEEMIKLLGERYYTFQNTVDRFTSVTPLFVLLDVANKENKSEKITKVIKAKIAELQTQEYPQED